MQQMQYREQLSDIKDQGDMEKLIQFSDELQKLTLDTVNKIATLFEQGLENDTTDLKNYICELQFLNKLALDLDEVEEHLLEQ